MARFKKHLLVVVGFAIAGLIGAAFGTGTAQAVVASLVQIANTTSSPVPSLNVTNPGRIAYLSTINNSPSRSGSTFCAYRFPVVPAGHRVVVQHINGIANFNTSPGASLNLQAQAPIGTFVSGSFLPVPATTFSVFDQSVLIYADSGT